MGLHDDLQYYIYCVGNSKLGYWRLGVTKPCGKLQLQNIYILKEEGKLLLPSNSELLA